MPSSLACAEQSRGARRKSSVLILLRETKLVRLWCAKKPPWLEGLVPHHRLRRGPHPRLSLLHRVTAGAREWGAVRASSSSLGAQSARPCGRAGAGSGAECGYGPARASPGSTGLLTGGGF